MEKRFVIGKGFINIDPSPVMEKKVPASKTFAGEPARKPKKKSTKKSKKKRR